MDLFRPKGTSATTHAFQETSLKSDVSLKIMVLGEIHHMRRRSLRVSRHGLSRSVNSKTADWLPSGDLHACPASCRADIRQRGSA